MQALLDVILPVFLVLGAGYIVARRGLLTPEGIDGLMKFSQNIGLPCLLFRGIARLDLATAFDPALMASFYLGMLAAFGTAAVLAVWLFRRDLQDAIAIGFAAGFSNSLLLGIPITERAYGADALAGNFAIIAVHAPVLYTLGITAMELARARGSGLSGLGVARQTARSILLQPLVIGILLGAAVNLTGLPLPGVVWSALDMLVVAALPTALFGLGGVLTRYKAEGDLRTIAVVSACSLLLHPGVAWGLGHLFGLSVDQLRSAVLTASMAPGVNAFLFAQLYGRAMRVAASSVLYATAASILTIWVWLAILP